MSDEQPSVPAATVAVLRDGPAGLETLLLRRAGRLAFHAGSWVFPGGRVDAADGGSDELDAARHAAVRELREEADVAVTRDDLLPVSHWTTPPGQARRFSTWFFAAVVAPATVVTVDGGEISTHRWLTAAAALAAQADGELVLPPPTFVTLTELAAFSSAQEALDALAARTPPVFVPKVEPYEEGGVSLYAGDAGYATSDPEVDGARHRLEMLPGGWRYVRAL